MLNNLPVWRNIPPVNLAGEVMGDDIVGHMVTFFVDQMVFGRGRWGQRFVWDERLGTNSVRRNSNTISGVPQHKGITGTMTTTHLNYLRDFSECAGNS